MWIILALFNTAALAQEKQTIFPYKPSASKEDDALEIKIKEEIGKIKNSAYYQEFLKYVACREETRSPIAIRLLNFRYTAEGKCNAIKDFDDKQICEALKSNHCDQLPDTYKNYCIGLREGVEIEKAITYPEGKCKNVDTKALFLYHLGLHWGFKYYSTVACERYMHDIKISNRTVPLCDQLSCQLLFSSNVETELAEIMRQLAILFISKNESDSDMCRLINNKKIKEACLSLSIKTHGDIFKR